MLLAQTTQEVAVPKGFENTSQQRIFELSLLGLFIACLFIFGFAFRRFEEVKREKIFQVLAGLLFVGTLSLIYMGAMVVSTRSGMAFMDWPTSHGVFWPSLDSWFRQQDMFYEHGHRLMAQGVGYIAILAVIASYKVKEFSVTKLSWVILIAVIVQGAFGGLTVQKITPWWASTLHGAVAQICLALMAVLWLRSTRLWRLAGGFCEKMRVSIAPVQIWGKIISVIVFIQLLTGAVFRHSMKQAEVNPDGTPKFFEGKVVYHEVLEGNFMLLVLHMTFAVVVTCALIAFAIKLKKSSSDLPVLRKFSIGIHATLGIQLILGVISFLTVRQRVNDIYDQTMTLLTSAHLANAALILSLVVSVTALAGRVSQGEKK